MNGPVIVCAGCGRPVSIYTPICPECLAGIEGLADELPPVIGERYIDVLHEVMATSRFAEPVISKGGQVVWPGQDYVEEASTCTEG